jgi:ABC-2 type transport system permease protein
MATTRTAVRTGTPRGSFTRLYWLVLRHQLTWGRAVVVIGLGLLASLVGLAVRAGANDPTTAGTEMINVVGFTTIVPVCALMFASSSLGDMVDDRTLVYVWLAPVPRFWFALAATLASITVALPLAVVPLTIAAAATGAGPELVWATALAAAVGIVGYCGLFTALGLRFRRALVWGIAYILLWEGFVATASDAAATLSLRAYTASILSQATGVGLRLGTLTMASGVIVPPLVGAASVGLTTWLLTRTDVD